MPTSFVHNPIRSLWQTEKSLIRADKGVYGFSVDLKATRSEVKKEVEKRYKVKVAKINMVNRGGKTRGAGALRGQTQKLRIAYVTLKAGDKIDLS